MQITKENLSLLLKKNILFLSEISPLMYPDILPVCAKNKLTKKVRQGTVDQDDVSLFIKAMVKYISNGHELSMNNKQFASLWHRGIIVRKTFSKIRFPEIKTPVAAYEKMLIRSRSGLISQTDADTFVNIIKPYFN